jgi:IPT/TIG domain/Putative Ig domain
MSKVSESELKSGRLQHLSGALCVETAKSLFLISRVPGIMILSLCVVWLIGCTGFVSSSKAPAAPTGRSVQIKTAVLPPGNVKNRYAATLEVMGGIPPYTWSIANGQFPLGVSLTSATGTISGTPERAGAFSFVISVQDSTGFHASHSIELNIDGPIAPAISGISPNNGPADGGTLVIISGSNFQPASTVRFGSSQAKAIQVVSANQIRAVTPDEAGGSVSIIVQDSANQIATAANAFTFVPVPTPPPDSALQILTNFLPTGMAATSYKAALAAAGGVPPYSWSVAGDQLPQGITLNLSTGAISGIPPSTSAGTLHFVTKVHDSKNSSASVNLSLVILPQPAPVISQVSPDKGSTDGGTVIAISGNNFRPGASVYFGNLIATSVNVLDSNEIQATTPFASEGTIDVTVHDPDSQTATAAKAYSFVAPPNPNFPAEMAQMADAFVDSIGVNVHLHFADTSYGNYAAVKSALRNLGVRHIRDGLIDTTWAPYYDRLNELGRLGIKSTLITSPKETGAVLISYPNRVPDSFEAYEAPNEYDLSGDPHWTTTLNAFMSVLHNAVRFNPKTSGFPIIGPSLTQSASFPVAASSAFSFDDANLHNYLGGRNPGTAGWGANGYGSIDWNIALAKSAWPNKPIWTTETGYLNDLSKLDSVPEVISGKYLPRVLLEQWIHGIKRTFIYELVDIGSTFDQNGFGLLHADFSPKPAYNSVKNILGLLSDPGPVFQTHSLGVALEGDLPNVHHLLLEKRTGTYYLIIWAEEPGYDVNSKKNVDVPAHRITIKIERPMTTTLHRLDAEGNAQSLVLGVGQAQAFDVSDCVTLVELSQ